MSPTSISDVDVLNFLLSGVSTPQATLTKSSIAINNLRILWGRVRDYRYLNVGIERMTGIEPFSDSTAKTITI